ncbi:MAG: hypothetical protein L3J11_10070 [Draconibacterium sp.]|nr:hypothetical protein [Draconibacterium sp.]
MAEIKTERQYEKAMERIEELLPKVNNETSEYNKDFVELDLLSDLVAEYEEKYFPVAKPALSEIIRLRMAELGITQKKNGGDIKCKSFEDKRIFKREK